MFVGKEKFPSEELAMLEQGESLFETDKNAVGEVLPLMQSFINSYSDLYQERLSGFIARMALDCLK